MNARITEEMLIAYVTGTLAEQERTMVDEQLTNSPILRAEVQQFRQLLRILPSTMAPESGISDPRPELQEQIMDRVVQMRPAWMPGELEPPGNRRGTAAQVARAFRTWVAAVITLFYVRFPRGRKWVSRGGWAQLGLIMGFGLGMAVPSSKPLVERPPNVPNAVDLRQQYEGQEIIYYGDSVGLGNKIDTELAKRFTEDTGISVIVYAKPQSASESYSKYEYQFQGMAPGADVYLLDVIWRDRFAQYLTDLKPQLGEAAKAHRADIVKNNTTTDGRLVAMPLFDDFGMLYYRKDLLERYGYSKPPETWDELQIMAQKIQDGERAAGNKSFTGWVWEGQAYEGLSVNAIEWIGGTIVHNGKVTVNNSNAVRALERAHSWTKTISPARVLTYKEEDARKDFQLGNAAFMRNWPYAFALLNDPKTSMVAGKIDVTPLPHDPGQTSVSIIGGQQLGVSKFSQHQEAAIEFVRYMTSPEVLKWRTLVGSYVPTIDPTVKAFWDDPQIHAAVPFLGKFQGIPRVARPSDEAGTDYNQLSTVFFQGVHRILLGSDTAQVLSRLERDMQHIITVPPVR